MENGELEKNSELEETLLPPVLPEGDAEVTAPPETPPPFTDEILKRVMAKAEQDIPQEREYELRHEKKGERVVPLAATAVSVGQVLAEADNSFFPELKSDTSNKRNSPRSRNNYVPLSRRELYKRAILLGFLSGLSVLVILGAVIIIR